MSTLKRKGPFTGRHMAAIFVAFFGVVIAVNLLMANLATGTFGGVVVKNSYVAGQSFNRWLEEAEAGQALGWKAVVSRRADNRLAVAMENVPQDAVVQAELRHPLGRAEDQSLQFTRNEQGQFVSTTVVQPDRWRVRLRVEADGKVWRMEQELR